MNGDNITIGFAENMDWASSITSITYVYNNAAPYTPLLSEWEITSTYIRMPAGYYQPGIWEWTITADGYEDATLTVEATVPPMN